MKCANHWHSPREATFLLVAGRLSDMTVISRYFCDQCERYIRGEGTVYLEDAGNWFTVDEATWVPGELLNQTVIKTLPNRYM